MALNASDEVKPATGDALLKIEEVDARSNASAFSDSPEVDAAEPTGCRASCTSCWGRWRGAIRMAIFLVLGGIPNILVSAIMPEVKKHYFGSDQKAAFISVLFIGLTTAINIFTVAPFARLTDAVGRRPLFLVNALATVAQFLMPVLFPTNPLPYMIVQSVGNLIQFSYAYAMVSDITAPEHRQWAFTLVSAIGLMSMLFALPVGIIDASNEVFFIAALVLSGLRPLYAYFFIPETLGKEARVPLTRDAICVNPFKELYTLAHSRALVITVVVMAIGTGIDNGMKDVYLFVLNDRIGFTKQDNGIFFPLLAVSALLGYFVVMPLVKVRLTPTNIITMSLLSTTGFLLVVATAWAPWVMFVSSVLYAPLILAFPTTQALVANTGAPEKTTARLTALMAVADIGSTLGPLIFGGLYDVMPDSLNQIPFFAFALITTVLAAVVFKLLPPALALEEEKRELAARHKEETEREDECDSLATRYESV